MTVQDTADSVANISPPPDLDDSRYELVERIGEGGVAVVWRALDRQTGMPVAIKLMQKKAFKLETVQRLAQEVEILVELSHPCIVQVYGTGVAASGPPYVAMEWVEGPTLRQRLVSERIPPFIETISIVEQIAAALSAAHCASIVHRDLKPENVILRPDGVVKVLDFGMAKVLRSGSPALTSGIKIFGTPHYMSPERARGKPVTAAADVYALGIIAYEMLNGRRPFHAKDAMSVLLAQCNDAPPPMEEAVAPELQEVVVKALAKDPEVRPSAGDFAHALRKASELVEA